MGDGVRRLERRQDALLARQPLERARARRRRRSTCIRRAPSRAATRARARPPRSRGRRKSNASARCSRRRPAARSCACPAGRRALPPANRAACSPGWMPWPPASTPIRRTDGSAMNASKMPIALLPPPTQATIASGSRPIGVEALRARLLADHRLELAHHQRIRMRAEHRPEQVVAVGDVGDPVAHRLVDGVLQRAARRRRRGAPSAPSSCMRKTLSDWRSMSSAPM